MSLNMSRCTVVCSSGQLIKLEEDSEMENEEFDDDSDIEILDDDMTEDREDNYDTKSSQSNHEGEQANTGIVLSVACLYEDDEVISVSESFADKSEVMDTTESSASNVKSVTLDKLNVTESSTADSDLNPGIIDITEVPELMMKSVEFNSQETSPSASDDYSESSSEEKSMDSEEVSKQESNTSETNSPQYPTVCINEVPQSIYPDNYKMSPKTARYSFEGKYKFRIQFPCKSDSRSEVYCEARNKLYIAKDHPFRVLVTAEDVPLDAGIRVCAVFAQPEHSFHVLKRCPTHSHQDFIKGNPAYEHVVMSLNSTAIYENNGHFLSVTVPYEKPHYGETSTSYLFKVTCFSSCAGGINRRPFMLVFILEKDNVVLAKQIVDMKVCSCPLRDYHSERKREEPKHANEEKYALIKEVLTDQSSHIQERNNLHKETSDYLITVRDPELFQFLRQMKAFFKMDALAGKIQNMPENML